MLRARGLTLFFALLPGCAALPWRSGSEPRGPHSAVEVRAAVVREADPYRKLTTTRGPSVRAADGVRWSLVCVAPAAGEPEFLVEVQWSGNSWRFLHSAYDIEGRAFEVRVAAREVASDALVSESVAVVFPLGVLDQLAGDLRLRLFGERGHVDVSVPQFYVRGFLDATRDAAPAAAQ